MSPSACSDQEDQLVCLEGSPPEVGRAFGAANAVDIRAEVEAFFQDQHRGAVLAATEHYRSLVAQYAPHWLDEAAALAEAADVNADEYIAYQGAKYRGINRPECFTYFSAPTNNVGNVALFHKNRDNVSRPQTAYVKGLVVPQQNTFRFAATGDTSDMGTMMGVNEEGLAAAADTGAPDPGPRFRGLMNPDVMRLILEQAADVEDARVMIHQIHEDQAYAGANVATNWMFADRRGRAVRIVQFHESLEQTHDEDGMLAMREDGRGNLVLSTLRDANGGVTPQLMNRLSRTEPVLAGSNISAMTAVIPSSDVDLFGYAEFAVCHAGRTVYVPLYLGCSACPRDLVDGTLYRLSVGQSDGLGTASEDFEADLDAERDRFEGEACRALEEFGREAARQVLTDGCLALASRAPRYLATSSEATPERGSP